MFAFSRQEIIVAAVFLVLGVILVFFSGGSESGEEVFPSGGVMENNSPSREESEQRLIIHVSGAVMSPGVYIFSPGDRIVDAIKAAGGVSVKADPDQVNLAAPLVDGMQVKIPFKPEEREQENSVSDQGLLSINQASREELEQLPNIGPARAQAIIEFREAHGGFQKPEDLLNISGIGEKTLERLREHIRFY